MKTTHTHIKALLRPENLTWFNFKVEESAMFRKNCRILIASTSVLDVIGSKKSASYVSAISTLAFMYNNCEHNKVSTESKMFFREHDSPMLYLAVILLYCHKMQQTSIFFLQAQTSTMCTVGLREITRKGSTSQDFTVDE